MHVKKQNTVKCSYETKCPAELLQCRTSDLTKIDLNRSTLVNTR